MVVILQLALVSSPAKRLSDVYGGAAGVVDASTNIPYRQLIITAGGASATLGSSLPLSTGKVLATTDPPMVLGPFDTGAVKLSDLYAFGAGATLTIVGVPF